MKPWRLWGAPGLDGRVLEAFLSTYPISDGQPGRGESLRARYGGCTFGGGIYRVHTDKSAALAHGWIAEGFPAFAGQVSCFGFDWLGRLFAADYRLPAQDPPVLMFEPGTGEVLEIPVEFSRFHDQELVDEPEAALAQGFFEAASGAGLRAAFNECVGYKVPLFLGGKDDLANLEVINIDVYWTIHAQLLRQLPG